MNELSKSYDVIVVGAGPSGLHSARRLAENGLKVLIVEKKEEIGEDIVCSGVVGTEIFDRFNISQSSILRRIKTAQVLSPFGTSVQYSVEKSFAYVIDREGFDIELLKMALTKGVQIQLKSSVEYIKVEPDGVEVYIKNEGNLKVYKSRVVVLATGINTNLSRQLGLGHPVRFLRAIQQETCLQRDNPVTIFVGNTISDAGFAWAIPSGEGRFRVGLMSEDDCSKRFRQFVNINFQGIRFDNPRMKPIAQGLVTGTFRDRVIVVGEAAGQIKTTTGGGIYWGLLCSDIAVNTLMKAFKKNDFSAKTLSEYEILWQKIIGSEIKAGLLVRKLCSYLNDNQIERIIQLAKADGLINFISKNAVFDWHGKALLNLLKTNSLMEIFYKR